jgi:hypothetical protein
LCQVGLALRRLRFFSFFCYQVCSLSIVSSETPSSASRDFVLLKLSSLSSEPHFYLIFFCNFF